MRIERLTRDNMADVYCCLGERRELFEDEISESLGYMGEKLEEGWLTYAAYDEAERAVGMAILVPPSDPLSAVTGEGVYYFHCLDIIKEMRTQGIGSSLLEKTVGDVKALGGKGVAVVCFGEYWMSCKFFKKAGFDEVKTFPDHSLLLRRITEDARAEGVEAPYRGDLPESGIQVDIQHGVACPFMINNFRKAKGIVKRIEPGAVLRERMISTKEDVSRWGGSGFYVNGKLVSAGPVDEDELKKAIEEAKRA
ncbi:MAG: GNAT family N-acetyltransferase [bacterium]